MRAKDELVENLRKEYDKLIGKAKDWVRKLKDEDEKFKGELDKVRVELEKEMGIERFMLACRDGCGIQLLFASEERVFG